MRCYACNIILQSPSMDKPTGRYYCSICLEPTNDVLLKLSEAEFKEDSDFLDSIPLFEEISIEELEEEQEEIEDEQY